MGQSAAKAPISWSGTERYEVIGALGQGGMGIVYEAFDRERRQLVALKKVLCYDPAALYLFKREFRTLADVRHTNLVHLYELVIAEGDTVFFTMELVRGAHFHEYARTAPLEPPRDRALETLITVRPPPSARDGVEPGLEADVRRTPLPPRTGADLERLHPALRQLVEGIHALHAAGKVHRDVKPSNVLVTPEGRVVILDFGVATELRARAGEVPGNGGEVVGTARYMAPEQAEDERPSPASDWYSVGVMLFEALVGRPPFVGSVIDVLTMKSIMVAPAPSELVSGVPAELDALCSALLHRDPAMRPGGAEILARLGVTRSSAPPSPLSTSTPVAALVGRSNETAVLRAAFDAAKAGRSVTVRVGGASGMGKSTLVHHFLDDLATRGEAVVLRGRAYEREAVPFKAVDTLVDSLSRHLLELADCEPALLLPADARLLARLFPVLQRVQSFADLPEVVVDDPQDVRHRAFAALRLLLASLSQRRTVVLFVDDAQWGDVDSAALVLDLLRPPEAPPLLLVMTYRDNEALASPFLTELRERWPQGADLQDIKLAPLAAEDALKLAMTLLEPSDELSRRTARAVARESRGSPFLIEELARSNRGAVSSADATLAVLTLDQMVSERLDRLPDGARRLVEILALGGRPLPVSATAVAAGVEESANETVSLLSARRFLRAGMRDGRDVIEMAHDRIRETVVAQLPEATLLAHHSRLAQALEDAPNRGGDAEAIAVHWLGAGASERAARFAEGAAEQAVAKLAFDQAVRLFRFTLDHASPEMKGTDRRRLQARLAEALRLAGRCEASARAYLVAAEGASARDRVEYQRAAAEQLLAAGRIDEGREILHRVLAAVGMSAPRSPLAAVFWLLVYRVWLFFLGHRAAERPSRTVSPQAALRIEALSTASLGFAIVDVIVAACTQARHLVEALRAGDSFHIARAMSIEAAQLAATGGRESHRERELVRLASALAEKSTDDARIYDAGARGIGLFNRGHWRRARELLDRANSTGGAGVAALVNVRIFALYATSFLGDAREARRGMTRLSVRAEERGDLYTLVNLRTSLGITHALVDDEPTRARRDLDAALAQWTQAGFHVQHWQGMTYGAEIDMYRGEGGLAYDRFMAAMPVLRKSFLLHAGFIRTMTGFVRGRLAIASIASQPHRARERIAEARRMASDLAREYDPWSRAMAHLVSAIAANAEGERGLAIESLRRGLAESEVTELAHYAIATRYRLGQLLGDDEGQAFMKKATAAAATEGIRDLARWCGAYLPGEWSGAK